MTGNNVDKANEPEEVVEVESLARLLGFRPMGYANKLVTDEDYQTFMTTVTKLIKQLGQEPLEDWLDKNVRAINTGWLTVSPQLYMQGSKQIEIHLPLIQKAKDLVDLLEAMLNAELASRSSVSGGQTDE